MTIDSPVYQFSYNTGFDANGSPKKPKRQTAYGEGWVHAVGTLQELIDHALNARMVLLCIHRGEKQGS